MAESQERLLEEQRRTLRGYELRLLSCTLAAQPPSDSPPPSQPLSDEDSHLLGLHSRINHLLSLIEAGEYHRALDSARLVFSVSPPPDCSPDRVYSELMEQTSSFLTDDAVSIEERACRVIMMLCLAVAAFFCFIQSNFTGPVLSELPKCPFSLIALEQKAGEFDSWACNQLISDGADLVGKLSNVQYVVFAKMLVMKIKDLLFDGDVSAMYGIRSVSWWLARVLFVQQRILDELSSSLFDLLQVCMSETLNYFGTVEKLRSYWGVELDGDVEGSDIVSVIHLEAGIIEHAYGRADACRLHFESAESVSGLRFSVTGVLGYRTVHQVEPKAQMVLVANKTSSNGGDSGTSIGPCVQTSAAVVRENLRQSSGANETDVLVTPMFLENGSSDQNDALGGAVPLKPIQMAMILAWCLLIEKSSRHDELQRWDMAPFIEAFDSQPSSLFILRCFCDLLRIRWERTRSRTMVRALEMMENLVEGVRKPSPEVAQRVPLYFMTFIPCIASLQKEHGELLVSCGLIGEAIKIFEALELWDNLIYCTCRLGKKAAAVELIKKRLSETPNDPRLWCSLGDVTNNDSCYEKALEVSNNKSARAKRSLARSAYNRGDYEASKVLWESAMALNSLYPDGWFALGAAALKARDVDKALYGFTQAVKLDPENGEAWNNIACLHMIKKKSKEAFIAFKEALKFKRDSWEMWENYSHVAMDVGNIRQALEAIQMVLHMTKNKRVDTELLERIMLEMENESKLSTEKSRELEQLLLLLGEVLKQMVSSSSSADVWGLYARWHKIRGDLTMCSEALLKQVRSYQGSDLWKDRDRFKKFAQASLELCKLYMEISSSTRSRRELFAAEMHLRNTIKQAESFSDTEEFKNLQAFFLEVKTKLN